MPADARDHAVLVNPHADRTRGDLAARIAEIVSPEHVFVSDTNDAYDDLVARLLDRGYDTVFTAGGDGTVNRFINALPTASAPPRIGVLPLGAGNGLASVTSGGGATDPLTDLKNYIANPTTDTVRLSLCEAEGTRFAFAGLGLDAAALSDFRGLLGSVGKQGPLHRLLNGRGGYLTAVFAVTFPRRLFAKRVQVRAINLGAPAQVVRQSDNGASVIATIGTGETLYEGPANATALGTAPFFGHRFRLLPFAGLDPQRFHLRISAVAPTRLLASIKSVRRGTFTHPALHDFLADRVRLEYSEPVPYQLAGELMGDRQTLEIAVSPGAVDLVRFN
ncbi:MAG: hypothetical protein CVU56_12910 [Deltaproteobacteria bacterium HGW-Deltaproteobacteria-14]|jgi:diacylglycerol kinase family enzyme|nr:MAG: hypothetical protein CVU56_12910 [Deltaproteobacteria bacterium HGW-Deltaproteobacteria-14]